MIWWCFNRLLAIFLTLYFTTYLSWPEYLYFYCFIWLKNADPYDHYAVCCVPITDQFKLLIYSLVGQLYRFSLGNLFAVPFMRTDQLIILLSPCHNNQGGGGGVPLGVLRGSVGQDLPSPPPVSGASPNSKKSHGYKWAPHLIDLITQDWKSPTMISSKIEYVQTYF